MSLRYKEAFAEYGARIAVPRTEYSAIAEDGSVVLSCWAHIFKPRPGGGLRYEDYFSRWFTNPHGKSLLQEHLQQAFEASLPVRLILATSDDPSSISAGVSSTGRNTFGVRKDLTGRVIELTSEKFVVDFQKGSSNTET